MSVEVMRRGFGPLVILSLLQVLGAALFLVVAIGYRDVWASFGAWAEASQIARIRRQPMPPFPEIPADFWLVLVVVVLVWAFIATIAFIAMLHAANSILRGGRASVWASLDSALDRMPSVIGLILLSVLVLVPLALTLLVPLLLGPIGVLIWILVVILGGIYLGIRLIPTLAVLAVEPEGPLGALGRTWHLTRGNLLITFGFTFVAGLLGSIATWIIGAAFLMLTPVLGLLLSNLGSLLVSLLVIPWSAASTMVLYGELRRRNDPGSTLSPAPAAAAP